MKHLLSSRDGSLAVITLNRPERRNALSLSLMQDLITCLTELDTDPHIKVVIVASSGAAFCSGHDLSEMTGRELNDYRRIFDVCTILMEKIQSIPQPVIAQVQGVATAAGCQLVAACDLAVASSEAVFATPGVKIGLFCTTPMVPVTRAVGRKRALEMLLTGKPISAATAADWGLVNHVVAPAELEKETRALAEAIAQSSSLVVGLGKKAFYSQIDMGQPDAYSYAKEVMSMNAVTEDAQEGMSAFLGKRVPHWKGR